MSERMTLWYHAPRHLIPPWLRKSAAVLCAGAFLATVALWIVHVNDQYWMERGPHVSIELPYVRAEVLTLPLNVQFRLWQDGAMRWPRVTFPNRVGVVTNYEYDRGYHATGLGFVTVWSSRSYHNSKFVVPPHAVLGLPYWFLIPVLGWMSLKVSGLWVLLTPYRKWTAGAWLAAGFLTLAWAFLNVLPWQLQTLGGHFWPRTVWEQVYLPLWPPRFYSEVYFTYGFPFTWVTKHFVDGKAVAVYHGSELVKAVEDVWVLVVAVWAAKLVLGWRRMRAQRKSSFPPCRITKDPVLAQS